MRPPFSQDEEYLVAYYRQYRKSDSARIIIQDIVTVAFGASFFLLGSIKSDVTWSIIGFVLVAYLVLRSLISGTRYSRILASIIEKYERSMQGDRKIENPEKDAEPSS